MGESQAKGDALEKAVKAIEEHILQTFPGYTEKTFTIEWKKRIVVDGVTHEIDVWVNIDLGPGYVSRVIFECKNREEKADKNDVIILAEKIEAAQAQQGFLVAKQFTKDAQAQARKFPRLTTITATDLLTDEQKVMPGGMSAAAYESEVYRLTFIDVWGQGSINALKDLDAQKAVVDVGADQMPLMDYLEQWKEKMHERFSEQFRKEGRGTGLYTLTYSDKRELGGTLRLNGVAVKSITMSADFKVRVINPGVVSHFDINKRGRAIRFAPFEVMGVEFDEPTITLLPPVEKPS